MPNWQVWDLLGKSATWLSDDLPDRDAEVIVHFADEGGEYEIRNGRVLKWMSANEFLSRAMEHEVLNDSAVKRYDAFRNLMEQ